MSKMIVCPYDSCSFNNKQLCTRDSIVLKISDNETKALFCASWKRKVYPIIKLDHDYIHINSGNIYKISDISVDSVIIYNTNNFTSKTVPRHSFHDRFVEVV